jgi:hypothetical protein
MKLVALNLNHKASLRAIKPRLVEAVAKLQPDVLTLNEYVHGETRAPLLEALANLGLEHVQVSTRLNGNNQVLVASRHRMDKGELAGPQTEDAGGASNFLHVILPHAELELVGVRAPAYETSVVLRDYWQKLIDIIRSAKHRRILFIGDLNADPDKSRGVGSPYLSLLREEGWCIPSPSGPWSYVSGSRIDHVVAAPGVSIGTAEYVCEVEGVTIASQTGGESITDHAALVVTLPNAA